MKSGKKLILHENKLWRYETAAPATEKISICKSQSSSQNFSTLSFYGE